MLVRQRTSLVNAVRAHLAEFGVIAPKGLCHVGRLAGLVEQDGALPEPVRRLCGELLGLITVFNERIGALDREVRERARADETARRLMTIKGVGPVTALALSVLAPPPETFTCGRDLAAWIGLTPPIRFGRQHSSGGVSRLGQTSRMGQRDLRRLLIIGASAVVRWARRPASADRLAPKGSWLAGMLERKPPMLVTVALANKTARIAWALMAKGGVYQAPAAAARGAAGGEVVADGRRAIPRYGQTVDETGSEKPVVGDRRRKARGSGRVEVMWTRSGGSPYGPAACRTPQPEAEHMSAPDHQPRRRKNSRLHPTGRPHMSPCCCK